MGDRPSSFARSRQTHFPSSRNKNSSSTRIPRSASTSRSSARPHARGTSRPFLTSTPPSVRRKVRRFRAPCPACGRIYAVKANPDRRVLKVLVQEGAGFEIARRPSWSFSWRLGVAPAEIFFSNREVARVDRLRRRKGVDGSSSTAPTSCGVSTTSRRNAKQYLRIAAPNIGSDWPLSGKFRGRPRPNAREIVALAPSWAQTWQA